MHHARLTLGVVAATLLFGCSLPAIPGAATNPLGGLTNPKKGATDQDAKTPATATVNSMTIDGKAVTIGGNGRVTQATYGGLVANLRFGGIPNGKPENAQVGEYTGLVQFGGKIEGDLALEQLEGMTLIIDEVVDGFKTGVKSWKTEFGKATFNAAGGPQVEIAGKDGVFTLVKVTGATVSPDKGQPGLAVSNDIEVALTFTVITKN